MLNKYSIELLLKNLKKAEKPEDIAVAASRLSFLKEESDYKDVLSSYESEISDVSDMIVVRGIATRGSVYEIRDLQQEILSILREKLQRLNEMKKNSEEMRIIRAIRDVVFALGQWGDESVIDDIVQILRDYDDSTVLITAVEALKLIGGEKVVDLLIKIALNNFEEKNFEPVVRNTAIQALYILAKEKQRVSRESVFEERIVTRGISLNIFDKIVDALKTIKEKEEDSLLTSSAISFLNDLTKK